MRGPQYLLLVLAGLVACGWGFPAAHRWPSPRNLLPSLVALLGIVMLMLGALLTFLPRFFQE
jgi:protein-S-isoprenylcysteine O-methyltransferase Ste14